MITERIAALREALKSRELDALVVTKIENVRYLSGFSGSNAVGIIRSDSATLITDGRYREQAGREADGWDLVIYTKDLAAAIAEGLEGAKRAGLEDSTTLAFHRRLLGALEGVTLELTDGVVEELRTRKDAGEIELIRAAVECARRAWDTILPMIQPGVTERQLASGLDYRMMTAGADKPAFDTIVASGPNSSMPHAGVTDRELAEGDLVVIDFGALKDGYSCDVTRTVAIGEPEGRSLKIMEAVLGAWDAAYAALAPGIATADVDRAARKHLEDAGLADFFVHGLGHGVGLEVHEKPTLSYLSKDALEPGMVFTIEPGVYVEGVAGARHEETVLWDGERAEILSREIAPPCVPM